MECSRCSRRYDSETRRPKLLPCGHTYCLPCLQGAGKCFSDSKSFPGAACLPDDEYTLALVTGDIRRHPDDPVPGQLQLWCRACAAAARDACVDGGHELVTGRLHYHEQVLSGLEQLAAALEDADDADLLEDDGELERLVGSAGVEVTLGDGDDEWTSRVQLGGSGEEDTDESWALRALLLLALKGKTREKEKEEVAGPPDTLSDPLAILGLGDGLFDEKQSKGPSGRRCYGGLFDDDPDPDESDDDGDACLAGMAALAEEEDEPLAADQPQEVRRLTGLNCTYSHDLQLLQQESPHLEELNVRELRREHLMLIQGMPRLRRLEVSGPSMWTDPFEVPAQLEHSGGLEFLKVCLTAPTAASLIRAHHRTLRTVQIVVPPRPRRNQPTTNVYFEALDYLGGGRVGPRVFRSPYFPRRLPGDFPVLERVEFLDTPRDPYVLNSLWITGKDLDKIERQLPGVEARLVFLKKPF